MTNVLKKTLGEMTVIHIVTRTRVFLIWPRDAIMCLRAQVDSEDPDQPAHSRSLIKTFTVH